MAQLATTLEAGTASGILAYSDNIYDKAQSDFISNLLSLGDKVQDVQVNGQSVVEDKVAKIDLTPYATSDTISGLNTKIENNTIAISQASTKITSLDSQISTCSKKVDTIESAVDSKLDQTVYYSDKKEIESKISTNTSDISTLNTTVDNLKASIPTKTSQLTNDSGYLTEHQSLDGYAKTSDVNAALSKKADTTAIPTKVSQLENDSNYVKQNDGITIADSNEIEMESKDGVDIIFSTWTNDDDDLSLIDGFFVYPYEGNPYITSDVNIKNGSILTLDDNSSIALFGSDDEALTINARGLTLGDGTAKQLFSADGKTYDITSLETKATSLESKVSTNATNITSLESKVSTNTSSITTINNTIGNIDTLLTTILNG